jgi:hypothetical protein
MDKLCVCAHGNHLSPCFIELFILLCQSTKFCSSDKCKICWIEEEYGPFAILFELLKGDLPEEHLFWIIRIHFKIRDTLPQIQSIARFLYAHRSLPPYHWYFWNRLNNRFFGGTSDPFATILSSIYWGFVSAYYYKTTRNGSIGSTLYFGREKAVFSAGEDHLGLQLLILLASYLAPFPCDTHVGFNAGSGGKNKQSVFRF